MPPVKDYELGLGYVNLSVLPTFCPVRQKDLAAEKRKYKK
jgi:hypothetical protein